MKKYKSVSDMLMPKKKRKARIGVIKKKPVRIKKTKRKYNTPKVSGTGWGP
jgi:hypothetical protein